MLELLQGLYGDRAGELEAKIKTAIKKCASNLESDKAERTQNESLLIAYGDHVNKKGSKAFAAMEEFFSSYQYADMFTLLHLLPFYPFTSDDGFSVVDYTKVDKHIGDWSGVRSLASKYGLVFDFPLNHTSVSCPWFQGFINGEKRYQDYYVTAEESEELKKVVRPRAHPLLTSFGELKVWTTFSEDQVDLNFENPQVLCDIIDIFLFYVENGARIIRLDAIAYLWKKVGTNCIHLSETHEVVKLFRQICEELPVRVRILTETNVPHQENMSYFGEGDEAHMIYQFSLPPLLLYSLWKGSVETLGNWLHELNNSPSYCCFLNFTASHDGVGVRPLEGAVAKSEFDKFVDTLNKEEVLISYKTNPDGTKSPYEINSTYFSLCKLLTKNPESFFLTQAFVATLRGIPAYYFSSLLAAENDMQGYLESGIQRRVNRKKYSLDELNQLLGDEGEASNVLSWFREMLQVRSKVESFSFEEEQRVSVLSESVLQVSRYSKNHKVDAIFNFSDRSVEQQDADFAAANLLLSRSASKSGSVISLQAYGFLWLESTIPQE